MGVINNYGRTLTGVIKPNLKPLLKSEEVKQEFFIISTLFSLRKDGVNSLGKLDHIILKHSKVNVIIFQKSDKPYYNLILFFDMIKNPSDEWKKTILKYKKQCQSVIQISNNIRYVGVINNYGRTLTGVIKPNLKPLLKSEEVKQEFFIISTLFSLRKNGTNSLGKLDYIILKHSKVNVIVFQKKDITFYISINSKEKSLDKIISLIKKTI